jgi:Na+(H+)/acetate symporter ActP
MEVLQTIGLFTIISQKIDNYVPDWTLPVGIVGFIGLMIGMVMHVFTLLGGIISAEWGLGITFILVISAIMFIAPSAYYNNRCGISISLNGCNTHLTSKFALSNNADRDAKKIKKIVDKYVKLAHQIDSNQKSKEMIEKEHRKQCCTQYQAVIEKVKPE